MGTVKPFRIKSFKKTNSAIEFQNISLAYGSRQILNDINFSINENTIHGLLGPNGAGKSSIYHLMTGIINPKNGKIKINNEEATNYPVYLRTKKSR